MITTLGIARPAAQALAMACAGLVLVGCGGSGADSPTVAEESAGSTPSSSSASTSPSSTPSESVAARPLPQCSDIWVDGSRLPQHYKGCQEGETAVAADPRRCSMGGRLVTYGDRFYAVIGGPVNQVSSPLAKDPAYRTAQAQCGA